MSCKEHQQDDIFQDPLFRIPDLSKKRIKKKEKIKWVIDPAKHYMGTAYIPKGKTKPVFEYIEQHAKEMEAENKKDEKVIEFRKRQIGK